MKDKMNWFQKKENIRFLLQVMFAAALPWLCAFLYLFLQGKGLGEVWLPGSEWNDELFYYKQVEGMVKEGYPLGYFGFNESHALKLSFAAWSPVLVLPWVLWGKIFGWTLLSPYICNLVLLSAAMGAYVILVRPSVKQELLLVLLFVLYAPFVRYLFSGMPEIICFSMVILFYGLGISEGRKHSDGKLISLFGLAACMSLMRPYFLLFLLLPAYFWIRKSGWKGLLGAGGVIGLTVLCYGLIKHYLGAAYFADLFFTDWIKAFFERGIFGGCRYTLGKLYYMGKDMGIHMIEGVRHGLASGAHFFSFLTLLILLFIQTVKELKAGKTKEGDKGLLFAECHLLFSCIAMFFALLLMYKLTEGSKHLLTFVVAGIFVVSLMADTKGAWKSVVLGLVFVYFYWMMARSAYDYQIPFVTKERLQQLAVWQERFEDEITLTREGTPSYDNVMIWVLSDQRDGKVIYSKWQVLYGLPEGMGISCCKDDYVLEHLSELESKYLITLNAGEVDRRLCDSGGNEIYRDADLVLYRLH